MEESALDWLDVVDIYSFYEEPLVSCADAGSIQLRRVCKVCKKLGKRDKSDKTKYHSLSCDPSSQSNLINHLRVQGHEKAFEAWHANSEKAKCMQASLIGKVTIEFT